MGLSPLESGLTTFPQAIGVAMMVQPVGRLYRRLGPRRMMMTGMAGAAVITLSSCWSISTQASVDPADHARAGMVLRLHARYICQPPPTQR